MRTRLALIGLCVIVSLGYVIFVQRSDTAYEIPEPVGAQTVDRRRFRLVSGSFMGDSATYTFQTPPEEKNYADDCIGCELEVGNAVIFADFGCPKKSEYLFDSNSERDVVEKIPILDSSGARVGEQRIWVSKDKGGKVIAARMYWIEGKDFWAVQAPSVELTKALRESEQYQEVRKKVAEEIKNYVPIQNANTIGKDRCEGGFTQKRIVH